MYNEQFMYRYISSDLSCSRYAVDLRGKFGPFRQDNVAVMPVISN